jgi:hypothetical protein
MKNALVFSLLALSLAACAPTTVRSSNELRFAPSSLGSKVSGTGSVTASSDGNTTYRLSLQNLPANATLGVGVYVGSCTNQGELKFALPNLKSSATGEATLEANLSTGTLPVKAYINVHQKSSEQGLGAALGCANIR